MTADNLFSCLYFKVISDGLVMQGDTSSIEHDVELLGSAHVIVVKGTSVSVEDGAMYNPGYSM